MRILTALVVAAGVLIIVALTPAAADAQTYGSSCIEDRYHRYSFTTPTGWNQVAMTLYYNQANVGFVVVLFDDEADVVVSSGSAERFVRFNTGLLPSTRYELWVGCTGSAAFRFDLRSADARVLTSHGTQTAFGAGYSAAEQARFLEREAVVDRHLARLARAF